MANKDKKALLKHRIFEENRKKNKNKQNFQEMKWYQKFTGFLSLSVLFIFWFIDRQIHVFMPYANHHRFYNYAQNSDHIKLTFVRMMVFALPIGIFIGVKHFI